MVLQCYTTNHWTTIWRSAASFCLKMTENSTLELSKSNASPRWWDDHGSQQWSSVQTTVPNRALYCWKSCKGSFAVSFVLQAGSPLLWVWQREVTAEGQTQQLLALSLWQSPVFNRHQSPETEKYSNHASISPGYMLHSLYYEQNCSRSTY